MNYFPLLRPVRGGPPTCWHTVSRGLSKRGWYLLLFSYLLLPFHEPTWSWLLLGLAARRLCILQIYSLLDVNNSLFLSLRANYIKGRKKIQTSKTGWLMTEASTGAITHRKCLIENHRISKLAGTSVSSCSTSSLQKNLSSNTLNTWSSRLCSKLSSEEESC